MSLERFDKVAGGEISGFQPRTSKRNASALTSPGEAMNLTGRLNDLKSCFAVRLSARLASSLNFGYIHRREIRRCCYGFTF